MYFTIERAGLLKKRFRARCFGNNHELVWMTQTFADKRDARAAIAFLEEKFHTVPADIRDLT